jgi:hypothetical protein
MPKVEFTVAEIKLPPAGKERGNIVTTDGRKYGLFREKISLCQIGSHYEAEVTDGQYCNIVSAKVIPAASPPAQQAQQPAPAANGGGSGNGHGSYYRRTDPVDSERMFVCAALSAFIKAGKIEPELGKVTNAITVLRQAYGRTFGFDDRVFTPSEAGHRHRLQAAE